MFQSGKENREAARYLSGSDQLCHTLGQKFLCDIASGHIALGGPRQCHQRIFKKPSRQKKIWGWCRRRRGLEPRACVRPQTTARHVAEDPERISKGNCPGFPWVVGVSTQNVKRLLPCFSTGSGCTQNIEWFLPCMLPQNRQLSPRRCKGLLKRLSDHGGCPAWELNPGHAVNHCVAEPRYGPTRGMVLTCLCLYNSCFSHTRHVWL